LRLPQAFKLLNNIQSSILADIWRILESVYATQTYISVSFKHLHRFIVIEFICSPHFQIIDLWIRKYKYTIPKYLHLQIRLNTYSFTNVYLYSI